MGNSLFTCCNIRKDKGRNKERKDNDKMGRNNIPDLRLGDKIKNDIIPHNGNNNYSSSSARTSPNSIGKNNNNPAPIQFLR
jgi:hypothetical protein